MELDGRVMGVGDCEPPRTWWQSDCTTLRPIKCAKRTLRPINCARREWSQPTFGVIASCISVLASTEAVATSVTRFATNKTGLLSPSRSPPQSGSQPPKRQKVVNCHSEDASRLRACPSTSLIHVNPVYLSLLVLLSFPVHSLSDSGCLVCREACWRLCWAMQ